MGHPQVPVHTSCVGESCSLCLCASVADPMRIKIIGDNDCARALRGLLRKAGFAVSEYLPPELVKDLRSEEHTSELQSLRHLVCRLLLEKKKSITLQRSIGRRKRVGSL